MVRIMLVVDQAQKDIRQLAVWFYSYPASNCELHDTALGHILSLFIVYRFH